MNRPDRTPGSILPFSLRIVLPTLLTVALFVVAIFLVLLPALEASSLERKREMIRELTVSAWNILANLHQREARGELSRAQAQSEAISQVQNLHYGEQMKDYFWINDMHPRMIVHPYRHDLVGRDLTNFADPAGKRLFVECVEVVRAHGAGFVEYQWQWKDDPTHVVPKLSYVKGFEPWGWVLGTGIYLQDVRAEVRQTTRRLAAGSAAILVAVSALLALIVKQNWEAERRRREAEGLLRASEARYRGVVEAAGESIIMALDEDRLFANASALAMLGYSGDELARLRLEDLFDPDDPAFPEARRGGVATQRRDALLRRKDGSRFHALVAASPITLGDKRGLILVASDITHRKQAEQAGSEREARLREELVAMRGRAAELERSLEEHRVSLSLMQAGPDVDPAGLRLLDEIRRAGSPDEVTRLGRAMPVLVKTLAESGATATLINRLITLNSDAVVEALVRLSIARLGPPPVPFAFIVLGSEGRREQTLCTDQDNAIIYADPPADAADGARSYFESLAAEVCDRLHDAGYAWCPGDVMAKNPRWCRPLSAWKGMFAQWLGTLEASDLLQAKIFFDFRGVAGDVTLAHELRAWLGMELTQSGRFFAQLARDVLQFRPPVGVFGQFHLEQAPDGRKGVSIKVAMTPIVDFARIYALRHGVEATNTLDRLASLRDAGAISQQSHHEIAEVYATLMQIRLATQANALAQGRSPDNLADPANLTHLQQRILKESFTQIRHFQTRLAYDFLGMPEAPA